MSTEDLDTNFFDAAFMTDVHPDPDRVIAPPVDMRTEDDNDLRAWVWIALAVVVIAMWAAIYLTTRGHA